MDNKLERRILRDMKINGEIFITVLIGFVFMDMFGFICWALSGQTPEGSFYIGVVTKFIISLFI